MAFKTRSGQPVSAVFVELKQRVRDAAPDALSAAALLLEGQIKEELSTPGQGRIRQGGRERLGKGSFNRGKDGKLHMVKRGAPRTEIDPTNRASAPGDPPAPDTGALRGSITHEFVDDSTVHVGSPLEYAAPLEFGTLHIAPRPFMRVAIAKVRKRFSPTIAAVLRKVTT